MGSVSLDIGIQALLTAQSALDSIGHNIANANTPGYSRQDLDIVTRRPTNLRGLEIGTGARADRVVRSVDDLLTRRLVTHTSSLGRVDARAAGMSEVEALLSEANGTGLSGLLDGLFTSFSNLSSNPQDLARRTGVTQAASAMTAQFHELTAELEELEDNAVGQMRAIAGEINSIGRQLADLNREIAATESTGSVANDLRDRRELALRELGKLTEISYHETESGSVQVFLSGQMLVGSRSANEVRVDVEDGEANLMLEGGSAPIPATGGRIGGLVDLVSTFLPELKDQLDTLARNLVLELGRVHSTGIPASGGHTRLDGSAAVQDIDGDGLFTDTLLASAGLPFDVLAGELNVNVRSASTGEFVTSTIAIDPSRMTVGEFVDELNAIPELSATLDSFGRLQILANSGSTFDFGRRLNESPDAAGTLGGGRPSLGSGSNGPFALTDGDTLDLNGSSGPFTVTFDATEFDDISRATAGEIASFLNADSGVLAGGMRAVAVGEQVFLQGTNSGSTQSFEVTGGSALGALGFGPQVVSGHDTAVAVSVSGTYEGTQNGQLVFRPTGDGRIGTTPGLQIEVLDEMGQRVAMLDVGENYQPGTPLVVADGVSVSFSFGEISSSNSDAFALDLVADADTSDVLVAFGLGLFFEGEDSESIQLRSDLKRDPRLLAVSGNGAPGDNRALLDMIALQRKGLDDLGVSLGDFYGEVIADVSFQINTTRNSREVEQSLMDSLVAQRDQLSGVNLDEELVDMIKFEQAYGAAAQYIQVVNALNDEILNLI